MLSDGRVSYIEFTKHTTLRDIKDILSKDYDIDASLISLSYQGERRLPDSSVAIDIGLLDGDMIAVELGQAPQNRFSLSKVSSRDLWLQRAAESEISRNNIEENISRALEENPESFARVLMLYIDVEVNSIPVKAFVDSGAQSTVMSRQCAETCGIMRLVDTRFRGVAVGVGQTIIIGRVHQADLKMGSKNYKCSFQVLDSPAGDMDLLLGLDMLRKHQCMIDMRNDCLHIGESEEIISFLPEALVPDHAKLN